MSIRDRSRFIAVALCSFSFAAVARAQSDALTLVPRGALLANSAPRPFYRQAASGGYDYHFVFQDASDAIEYVVSTADPAVRDEGLLRVREVTTNSFPIHVGGLAWRTGTHATYDPATLAATYAATKLVGEHLDPTSGMLSLRYAEDVDPDGPSGPLTPLPAAKTYTFQLVGKVRVHVSVVRNRLNDAGR